MNIGIVGSVSNPGLALEMAEAVEASGLTDTNVLVYYPVKTTATELSRRPKIEPFKREAPKICRNAFCPCGSGKKYKHCCVDANKDDE
jgi:uncharacterized protein YecA (UPF0149 family)